MAVFRTLLRNADQYSERTCSDQRTKSDSQASRVFRDPLFHMPPAYLPWEDKLPLEHCGHRPSSLEDDYDEPEVLFATEASHVAYETEVDFIRKTNPFVLAPGFMGKFWNPKLLGLFHALGGIAGIENGLRSDCKIGLTLRKQHIDGQICFEKAAEHENYNAKPKEHDLHNICRAQKLVCQHHHEAFNLEGHDGFDRNNLNIYTASSPDRATHKAGPYPYLCATLAFLGSLPRAHARPVDLFDNDTTTSQYLQASALVALSLGVITLGIAIVVGLGYPGQNWTQFRISATIISTICSYLVLNDPDDFPELTPLWINFTSSVLYVVWLHRQTMNRPEDQRANFVKMCVGILGSVVLGAAMSQASSSPIITALPLLFPSSIFAIRCVYGAWQKLAGFLRTILAALGRAFFLPQRA